MERMSVPDLHVIDYEDRKTLQLILGVDHTRCVDQFDAYKFYYNQFLGHVATHDANPVILYEGVTIPNDEESEEDCLRSGRGEVSLLFRWAQRDGIRLKSFEMDDTDLLEKFYDLGGYPEMTGLYLMLRQHRQWYDMPNRPDFTEYMDGSLERYRKAARELNQIRQREIWPVESFEVDGLIAHFNQIYEESGRQFDVHDKDFYYRMTAKQPTYYDNDHTDPLRLTAMYAGRYRRTHISNLVRDHTNKGDNIFAFIGKPHAKYLAENLQRDMRVVSVIECAGRIATNSSHRPKVPNAAPKYMASFEYSIPSDEQNVPVITYAQGDSMNMIVGVDDRQIPGRLSIIRHVYEQFLDHGATHETELVMADGFIDDLKSLCRVLYPEELLELDEWAESDDISVITPRMDDPATDALFYSSRKQRKVTLEDSYTPTFRSLRDRMDNYLERRYEIAAWQAYFRQHSMEMPSVKVETETCLRLFEHYYGEPLPKNCRISSSNFTLSSFPARFPNDYLEKVYLTHLANVIDQHASEHKSVFMYVDTRAIRDLIPRLHRNRLIERATYTPSEAWMRR